ncbi:unnamed protein product, partial [Nesidiocoris tenuis]
MEVSCVIRAPLVSPARCRLGIEPRSCTAIVTGNSNVGCARPRPPSSTSTQPAAEQTQTVSHGAQPPAASLTRTSVASWLFDMHTQWTGDSNFTTTLTSQTTLICT